MERNDTRKKVTVELSLEGPFIRGKIILIEKLLEQDKVFSKQPEPGGRQYIEEMLFGGHTPALLQPARGLVTNIRTLIGGSVHPAETPESLNLLLAEALEYAEAMEEVYVIAIDEAKKRLPPPPFISPTRRHVMHARKNHPLVCAFDRQRR
jgi:hypothetical protein